jgi:hypothetical protein
MAQMTPRMTTGGPGTARVTRTSAHRLRRWLLPLIAADLVLIALRATSYRAFFLMPGALGYLLEPVVALAVYAACVAALPFVAARVPDIPMALRVGAVVALVGGAIEIASTATESLWALPQDIVAATTGAAMLALFLSFAAAGFVGARHTGSFGLGVAAAVWSAMVAILLVVTFGFLLVNLALPQLARAEAGDPDYLRSGWTDVRAFAVANTYDAGFTHLVEAPVIAALLGAAGSGVGRLTRRSERLTA